MKNIQHVIILHFTEISLCMELNLTEVLSAGKYLDSSLGKNYFKVCEISEDLNQTAHICRLARASGDSIYKHWFL